MGAQAAAVDGDDGAGLDLLHAVPHGVAGRLDEGEQLAQAVERDRAAGKGVGEDRLGLGAEEHAVGGLVVVEGLDAHPVADHDEALDALVPDRERVHAVEAFGDGLAPFEVAVQDDLGVGVGGEPVPAGGEFGPQLGEVVGLARVDEGDRPAALFDGHGLAPARKVDDREPAVAESGRPVGPDAAVVGTAAVHRLGHRVQGVPLGAQFTVEGDPAGDATHGASCLASPAGGGRTAGRIRCIEQLPTSRSCASAGGPSTWA